MPKLSKSTQLLRAKKLMSDFVKSKQNRKKLAEMRNTTVGNISREFQKPYVQEYIQKSMSKHLDSVGVTDENIAIKIKDLMNATTKVGKYGQVTVDDNSTQVRATELALKVKKHIGEGNTTVNILNVGISSAIKKGRERLKAIEDSGKEGEVIDVK